MSSNQVKLNALQVLQSHLLQNKDALQHVIELAYRQNSWFDEASIRTALTHIAHNYLDGSALLRWLQAYQFGNHSRTVGLILAGNIPLVGFHDYLCLYMSPHKGIIKCSSKDCVLLPYIHQFLCTHDAALAERIQFVEQIKGAEAFIATGSNNSAEHFRYYFKDKPNIIRQNRTSIAVLDGSETPDEWTGLGKDMFTYYGLGCRNVSQLWVPTGYDFAPLLQHLESHFQELMLQHKYKNNYDYHLSIYLLNKIPHLVSQNLILVENPVPFSAVSVIHYQTYTGSAQAAIDNFPSDQLQCIIGHGFEQFGHSQLPTLHTYADGVDIMAFLQALSV